MAVGHLSVCPLWRKVYSRSFAHFLIGSFVLLVWSHVSSLYILEIKLLSEVSMPNTLPNRVVSLSILLMFSSSMQKLFIFVRSYVFILSFMFLAQGDIAVKISLCGISKISPPMTSSTFMVSQLIFSLLSILSLFLCMA